jgi:hypothetical protein
MTQRFILEIESGSQRIRGTIGGESGVPIEFQGWLGLAAALDQLFEAGAPAVPIGSPRESDGADANR